jgi:N-acetyl sugar amidotransferase
MSDYKICSRCVMDTSDAKIKFDKDGVCDHCLAFDKNILPVWNFGQGREKQLKEIVDKIKQSSKGKDFDCILGMSGGIDSSYLLYLVTKKLDLKPLVFHVDAGWNSQIAVNNIEKLVDGLGLDLYTEVIDWEEMKDLQRSFFKSGVPHVDTPQDHAFFATMYKFASNYNIKNIITGGNFSTECTRNPKDWMYYQSDSTQLKDIHKKFGQKPLKNFPLTSAVWHRLYLPLVRGIKLHRILDYMEYNKKEATKFLVNNYGYQEYPQKHFESRFTRFYESYWLPERFGFDTRRVQFSSLILTNQMSRDEAIEILKQPSYDKENIKHEFEYISSKLDMSIDELKDCMNMPLKTYKDFKSQDYIYKIGATVSRILSLEAGGKR